MTCLSARGHISAAGGPWEPCCGINTTGHLMCLNFLAYLLRPKHCSHLISCALQLGTLSIAPTPCASQQLDCYAEVLSAPSLGLA